MKKAALLFACMACLFILAGCREGGHQPIAEDQTFAATLNVDEFSIDFLGEDGEKVGKWRLDKAYTGALILPDGDTLLLYGPELTTADLYSLKKGKRKQQIDTGKGVTNAIFLKGQKEIAFADKNLNQIRFFDRKGTETHIIKTADYPMSMQVDDQGHLYAASFKAAKLHVIDLKRHRVNRSFDIPSSAAGMLIRDHEEEIWIGGHGDGTHPRTTIAVYDLLSGDLKEEIEAPLMPVDFCEKDSGIYALSHGTNKLYLYNENKELLQETEIGANPFAIASLGASLLVAGFDSDTLYWVDPETLEIQMSIPVGKGPFVIFTREKVT